LTKKPDKTEILFKKYMQFLKLILIG